ncbi:prepilin peptidase [Petralouisia muris]|jgi:prepilin peptidase CpaA|uniref:Prepilin peptidase n=1 Tax=Petralouisia muris TaxID=3032872 RepID=A0AC61RVU6_9FIRM|nr:A24 family peptidase [Petralouisia muris]TGY96084.1 prepilin peptidase [Petralouisia muris]
MFSLLLLISAAVMDIRRGKISNRLILCGLAAGLFFQFADAGWKGAGVFLRNVSIPVILCYLLFLIRALGAGDIKLFSVIGGIWNLEILTVTIMISFLAAAGISFCKMLYHHNLVSRLCIFGDYIHQVIVNARLSQYPKSQGKQHIIHFSIAILIGFIIALEVAY